MHPAQAHKSIPMKRRKKVQWVPSVPTLHALMDARAHTCTGMQTGYKASEQQKVKVIDMVQEFRKFKGLDESSQVMHNWQGHVLQPLLLDFTRQS